MHLLDTALAALDFSAEPIGSVLKILGALYLARSGYAFGKEKLAAAAARLKK